MTQTQGVPSPTLSQVTNEQFYSVLQDGKTVDDKHTYNKANNNMALNRFQNILANDSTTPKIRNSEYINANVVRYNGNFIKPTVLTQGPLPHTIDAFYEMCYFQAITDCIMLCQFVEQNRIKCEPYFPSAKGESFKTDEYEVTCLRLEVFPFHEVRFLAVQKIKSNDILDTFVLRHHWYKNWPDFGVPSTDYIQFFSTLFPLFNPHPESHNLPLIHCSAGVGRSGTLLLTAVCSYYEKSTGTAVNFETFKKLFMETRQGRAHSIQTAEQLRFAYDVYLISRSKLLQNQPLQRNSSDERANNQNAQQQTANGASINPAGANPAASESFEGESYQEVSGDKADDDVESVNEFKVEESYSYSG